jgi:predicted nucleic acid-binding protein
MNCLVKKQRPPSKEHYLPCVCLKQFSVDGPTADRNSLIGALSRQRAALNEVVVTTMWVLTELGDALHHGRNRETFARFLDALDGHEDFEVVPASPELFQRGVELFRARPDKEWSLTDCISFIVMDEKELSEALTGDRHFEQAGFKPLLK